MSDSLALAVVHADAPVLLQAYGLRDVEASLPVTSDTQFNICSITKSFTAAGLGILVDEGRLDWTKPVRDYLPEFRLHDPVATDRVTVCDLLCHHSGLPRHEWIWMPGDLSREQMLQAMRYLEPNRDIRACFQYQNLGYVVAGMVAERITGKSWEEFTRERLLTPLGMTQVGFSPEELEQTVDSARPYVVDGLQCRRTALWPIRDTQAGGINASIAGMANWLRCLLDGGRFAGIQLLSLPTLQAMQAPRVYVAPSEHAEFGDMHYGLGLGSHHYRGDRVVEHGGGWIGWGCLLLMVPERRIGVVVLSNRDASPVPEILAYAAVDALCNRDRFPWLDRFRKCEQKCLEQEELDRRARAAARKSGTRPSHPLSDYAGEYEHPAYGRMVIAVKDGNLRWSWRGITSDLAHRHYDVFELPERPGQPFPDLLTITFGCDEGGIVDQLSTPLEPLVPDIGFGRVPGGELPHPRFAAACVGTYRDGPRQHVIALDADGNLTVASAGEPARRLLPYYGNIFAIAGLEGFHVEFLRQKSGMVTEILFQEPDGTFIAQRSNES
jgi:CubicO group peptidase (beta-lactamase class C family)